MKSELEYILPHVNANAFEVSEAQEQVADKTKEETLQEIKETLQSVEEKVKKGAKKVKEKTSGILKSLKEFIPR